jgi:hypothetical protein
MQATEDERRRKVLAAELIDFGFKRAAARHHPDHGGAHRDMVLLSEIRDQLLQLTGARRIRVPGAPRPVRRPPVVVPTLGTEATIRQDMDAHARRQQEQVDGVCRIGAALTAAKAAIPDRRTYLAWLHALGFHVSLAEKLIEFAALTAKGKGK